MKIIVKDQSGEKIAEMPLKVSNHISKRSVSRNSLVGIYRNVPWMNSWGATKI